MVATYVVCSMFDSIKVQQKIVNLKTGVGIDLCNNKLIYSNI